jgi:hypothetical protein
MTLHLSSAAQSARASQPYVVTVGHGGGGAHHPNGMISDVSAQAEHPRSVGTYRCRAARPAAPRHTHLGASSRIQAVARSRELGLLEG